MITTITIILVGLIALNFLLLKFSCNKTTQVKEVVKPYKIKANLPATTTPQLSDQLAPTGS